MPALLTEKTSRTMSLLEVRSSLGQVLKSMSAERRSVIIQNRGTPAGVLMSIQDYVRLAAPEPEILRILGEESKRKGTDKLTSRQIDAEIKKYRAQRKSR